MDNYNHRRLLQDSNGGEDGNPEFNQSSKGYVLSGEIMLIAIVILFAVVVFMVCLHIYARWYLLHSRRRNPRGRSRRRTTHLVFYAGPDNPNVTAASRGLDAAVLSVLPVSLYSPETHPDALECAVCLCEFEEGEKIRNLPKCKHSFHVECIDMWFHSHSTCPLCRSPVDPVQNLSEFVISVPEPDESEPASSGSSSGSCDMCRQEERGSSSSLGDRRKAFELHRVTIEVPRRTESDNEFGPSSPIPGFKSPASRLMALKRILSMNRKGKAVSPSSGVGTSSVAAASELDVECGRDESTQQQTRAQTPR